MSRYNFKHKNLPDDVQAILRNKSKVKKIEVNNNSSKHSPLYRELRDCLRKYRKEISQLLEPGVKYTDLEINQLLEGFKEEVNVYLEYSEIVTELAINDEIHANDFNNYKASTAEDLMEITNLIENIIKKHEPQTP